MANLRVHRGEGLGGRTLQTGRPAFVRDYENAQGITSRYRHAVAPERLRSVVCLPVALPDQTAAVVYLGSRTEHDIDPVVCDRLMPIVERMVTDLRVESEVQRRLRAERDRLLPPRGEDAGLGAVRSELEDILAGTQEESTRDRLRALLAQAPGTTTAPETTAVQLSAREVDVLRLAELGLTNIDVAGELGLQPTTVKAYMKTAMGKLDASNRIQAARSARALGLL